MTAEPVLLGASVKVWLPGETPWAKVVAVNDDGSWIGRIANRLYREWDQSERDELIRRHGGDPELHRKSQWLPRHEYKEGDEVRFRLQDDNDIRVWVPA